MSQALEKWFTKRGRVGQVVVRVNLYARPTILLFFAAACWHRELNLLWVLFFRKRVWRGSVLMCKNRLLLLYSGKLPGFVPCGHYQHVFPRWPQSLQNSSQLWKQDNGTCVLVSINSLFQLCVCNLPRMHPWSASDVTCVDIPTCIVPPQLFQFTKNFSASLCTYSSSDVLSILSTCTFSIEKRCWEWTHMVSHSTETQHLWIGMYRFSDE